MSRRGAVEGKGGDRAVAAGDSLERHDRCPGRAAGTRLLGAAVRRLAGAQAAAAAPGSASAGEARLRGPLTRAAASLAVVALLAGLSCAGALAIRFAGTPEAPCRGRGTAVVVHGRSHQLFLCRDDRAEGRFTIALGRAGLDKGSQGDGRTPIGAYPLGAPRASGRFHVFVPVGYPTPEQRAQGRTGGAIGVHGPHCAFRSLGTATTWIDWTQGCVALGSRAEIENVAAWIDAARPREIVIE